MFVPCITMNTYQRTPFCADKTPRRLIKTVVHEVKRAEGGSKVEDVVSKRFRLVMQQLSGISLSPEEKQWLSAHPLPQRPINKIALQSARNKQAWRTLTLPGQERIAKEQHLSQGRIKELGAPMTDEEKEALSADEWSKAFKKAGMRVNIEDSEPTKRRHPHKPDKH